MARNQKTDGVILKNTRFGDIHKSVTFISPDLGLLSAVAHGAYKGKSKLGGVTEVFSRVSFHLYHDPVKNSYKITDIELRETYEFLRGNLRKFYIGSLWSEVILRTFAGGGEYRKIYELLSQGLSVLNVCKEPEIDSILSLFLYHYIENLGYLPNFGECGNCGSRLDRDKWWYLGKDGEIRCSQCGNDQMPSLTPGARGYLSYASSRSFKELQKVNLDSRSSVELKRFMLFLVQHVIGAPLKSLKGSEGLI